MKDKRTEKTLNLIKSSYIKLSRTKPLHKITVKDICDDANINRGTFYKYYCDIIELGKALEREAAERFASAIVDEYRFDANSDVCREGLFRCVKEYPDDAYILFSLGSIDKPNRATDILYELLREKRCLNGFEKAIYPENRPRSFFIIRSIVCLISLSCGTAVRSQWRKLNSKSCSAP